MALPRTTGNNWFGGIDFPSRLMEMNDREYELYEEDDEFVLSVELPGFDPEEISVAWDDGVLNISAQREDEEFGERRTYHRRFRFPKTVDEEEISAQYTNGILEVRLPVELGAVLTGREIEIET